MTVGLIGAGKFGTMFLAQARLTRGMHLVGVADLDVDARPKPARAAPAGTSSAIAAASLGDALKTRRTYVTPDAEALIALPEIEVIVEATGIRRPASATRLRAIAHGKHIVMVNVEADALAGPLLGAQGQGSGRGLQPRLGRSAGADLRAGRLGARLRLQGDRRRQGHALRAASITAPRPTQCGTSSTNTCRSRIATRSIRRCSTASSTAPSPASR